MVDERWYGGPPTPPQRSKRKVPGWALFLAVLAVGVAATATWVMLQRLSDAVLTVIATIACAAGVSLPGLLVAVLVLLRRAEHNGRQIEERPQAPQMTQPVMMVIPPQMLPGPGQYPQSPAATWENAPAARRFTVVGGGHERQGGRKDAF